MSPHVCNRIDFDMFLIREFVTIHEGIQASEIYIFPTHRILNVSLKKARGHIFSRFLVICFFSLQSTEMNAVRADNR